MLPDGYTRADFAVIGGADGLVDLDLVGDDRGRPADEHRHQHISG
jgi:hypothetical protein